MYQGEDKTAAISKDIERFWRHLFGGQSGFLQVWTIKEDNIKDAYFSYPKAAPQAAEWALEKAQEEGREVYFCVHLLTEARRIKENAQRVLSLWGDLDGADIPNGELKPTAVVESSPGHYHCYWRLADWAILPEAAEKFNRRLAHTIGADPSGFDLTQLLRVPFTPNNKYSNRPMVRLEYIDGGRTYHYVKLEELLSEIKDNSGDKTKPDPEPKDSEEPPVNLEPAAVRVWRGERPVLKDTGEIDRSKSLMKIGRVVYDAGANRRVVVAALQERDRSLGWRKYADNRDGGQREYERIYEKLKAEGRNPKFNVSASNASNASTQQEWPEMDDAAYRGLFGDIVELVEPHTEGDPTAVLASALVSVGNAIGRGPYIQIGATKHRVNLFCGIVGDTAKGRKGSTWSPVKNIMHASDNHWAEDRVASGLSSGEGLINEVRDPVQVPDGDGGMKTVDAGISDKRLLIMEGELSQALKQMKREGNTLSPVMRNGWDGETLRTMVKHSPLRATDPHISVLGHITRAELTKHLAETEMANGLANRFLWLLAKRSKSLPFGGEWHTVNLQPVTTRIVGILEYANTSMRMDWGQDARELWCEAYEKLSADRGGMFGAVTARAEAQTLRLSMLYALADYSQEIRRSHVESALAVWQYAEESARYIFGDLIGDPDCDKVLAILKTTKEGLTRTEISDLFGRNKSRQDLDRIQTALLNANRIRVAYNKEEGSKKPIERWYAV